MKRLLSLFSLCLATGALAANPAPRPEDFAHRGEIVSSGSGPFHRLALPLAVYQGASRGDLGDLRVLNAAGEALPYAWWRAERQEKARTQEAKAAFFPLPAAAASPAGDDVEVSVRRQGDGTLVAVRRSTTAPAATGSRGVVIDASRLQGAQALRLQAQGGSQPFHAYTLESSDDLQHWQLLKDDAIYVHLSNGQGSLDSDEAAWGAPAGRYLRLLWRDPAAAPQVQAVTLRRSEREVSAPTLLWSSALAPVGSGDEGFDYELPASLPLEQLRIGLPQENLLLPYTLQRERCGLRSSRHGHLRREECYWENLASGVAYRLRAGDGEASSPDVVVNAGSTPGRLRLRVDARAGLGNAVPTLQLGFVPRELVFLARGNGPYTLVWGGSALPADLPLSTLLPGQRAGQPPQASSASLRLAEPEPGNAVAAPGKVAKPAAAGESRPKWLLWGVLGIGLLVLAVMARSLLAQMKKPPLAD